MHRIGSIPFETRDGEIALLFVTSHTRRRWILPKGVAKPGESHSQTCSRECFEEAGVTGVVLEDFPLEVSIEKQCGDGEGDGEGCDYCEGGEGDEGGERGERGGKHSVPVTFYPLLVESENRNWPEMDSRKRHWAMLEDARELLDEKDYLSLVEKFRKLKPKIARASRKAQS